MKTLPIAIIAILSVSPSLPARAGTPCDELLADNYACRFIHEYGGDFTTAMHVSSPAGAGQFDIYIPGASTTHQCICQAGGSFTKAKYRESAEFLCNDAGNYAEAMVGKVTKKGIKNGQYMWSGGGTAYVFECDAATAP